ncbi:hypothetical protein [Saccharopolyspora phatthalungensis]|uniref:Uncharacterized protein n=1 Tax=Saccharopolyspora phatthalungensis TaxID=664693 RepID=A0A840Q6A0_9PSEU|nr:hypothetical protein [Saccharopolyspora phatthalungensis]MBB5155487.1 hypothetical protein [Saccharopolyspora phatthalungensis]
MQPTPQTSTPRSRTVRVWAKHPETGEPSALNAQVTWQAIGDDEVQVWVTVGPDTYTETGTNLFYALFMIRLKYLEPNWILLLTKGCRHDVWSPSPLDPRYFPGDLGVVEVPGQGVVETVDLLEPAGDDVDKVVRSDQQMKQHSQNR